MQFILSLLALLALTATTADAVRLNFAKTWFRCGFLSCPSNRPGWQQCQHDFAARERNRIPNLKYYSDGIGAGRRSPALINPASGITVMYAVMAGQSYFRNKPNWYFETRIGGAENTITPSMVNMPSSQSSIMKVTPNGNIQVQWTLPVMRVGYVQFHWGRAERFIPNRVESVPWTSTFGGSLTPCGTGQAGGKNEFCKMGRFPSGEGQGLQTRTIKAPGGAKNGIYRVSFFTRQLPQYCGNNNELKCYGWNRYNGNTHMNMGSECDVFRIGSFFVEIVGNPRQYEDARLASNGEPEVLPLTEDIENKDFPEGDLEGPTEAEAAETAKALELASKVETEPTPIVPIVLGAFGALLLIGGIGYVVVSRKRKGNATSDVSRMSNAGI